MKNLNHLDKYRQKYPTGGPIGDEKNGAFKVFVNGKAFYTIASSAGGWEHVSVSLKNQKRTPTWEEMCAIKDMFFEAEEEVVQYHPKKSEYVNIHEYTLHLWRPIIGSVTTPPKWMV